MGDTTTHGAGARPWHAFREGLTRPSLPALAIALALPLAGFAALTLWITPRQVAEEPEVFATDPWDGDLFASAEAARLRRMDLRDPGLFLFGASSIMSALTSLEDLERQVAVPACGAPCCCEDPCPCPEPCMGDLMAPGQTSGQTVALAEMLPPRFDGVVVVEVNPRTLAADPATLPSRVARLPEEEGPGSYFWANRRFFLPRVLPALRNLLWSGPVRRQEFGWLEVDRPLDEESWLSRAELLREKVHGHYHERVEANLEAYGRLVRDLRERGDVRIAFLEAPVARRTVEEFLGPGIWEEHRERMRRFAREHGVAYWDLTEEAGLADSDFYDYTHLFRREARERFTAALARRIAGLLGEVVS